MRSRQSCLLLMILLFTAENSRACSICGGNFGQSRTYREDSRLVKVILVGKLANPRIQGDQGFTDVNIEHVVQNDAAIAGKKQITLPRYVPIDPKNPPRYLFLGDMRNGNLDILRGIPIQGLGILDYLKGSLKLDDKDRSKILLYHFKYLDSKEPDVAMDAFLEFAKATDQEINQVAGQLAPEKLRKLLNDPATSADRLGLLAYLLGACGNKEDAALLSAMIAKNDDRSAGAMTGLLAGLIELNPDEGWKLIDRMLQDPKRPYGEKLSAISTIRFCEVCKPKDRKRILRAYSMVIQDGDLADMAIEDLRRWQWWDLTGTILAQYGKKSHSAPLIKRCIVRYAMCCPEKDSESFVQARRLLELDVVKIVEEGLQRDKPVSLPRKDRP